MARTTIATLSNEVQRLNQDLRTAGLLIEKLRLELSVAKANAALPRAAAPTTTKPLPADYDGYWDYVRATKKWCYAANRPVSYASREQWLDALAQAGVLDESHDPEREWLTTQAERNGDVLPN